MEIGRAVQNRRCRELIKISMAACPGSLEWTNERNRYKKKGAQKVAREKHLLAIVPFK
jgi:hypothetical protein